MEKRMAAQRVVDSWGADLRGFLSDMERSREDDEWEEERTN